MIKNLLYTFFFLNIAISEVYQDRLRVYIDNSIKNFQINKEDGLTNIQDLNKLLKNFEANKIQKWLPNALPSDRDGEIYLNRYYIVYFRPNQYIISIDDLKDRFENLVCIHHAELVTINRPTFTPNDPYWNSQYLSLIHI